MALQILMVAAENDALPGGKVGGEGDVVRDVPLALAEEGCDVAVVVPSYGFLHNLPNRAGPTEINFKFAGRLEHAWLHEVIGRHTHPRVRQYVLHHELFLLLDPKTQKPRIFWDDPPQAPFATDATKFARFCAAVAAAIEDGRLGVAQYLHLHDWHTAPLLILRRCDPRFQKLRTLPTVFTIHNLAFQGIRPFHGDDSSLAAWFPGLRCERNLLVDPRYADCINLMAVGIRFADKVHVVSQPYAQEILKPATKDNPYLGGQGLEADLQQAQPRLIGILNGCEYPPAADLEFQKLIDTLRTILAGWREKEPTSEYHRLAAERLAKLQAADRRPRVVLTCVTRVTEQKVLLMVTPGRQVPERPLARILAEVGDDGVFLLVGSGDPVLEQQLLQMSNAYGNFVFLKGYSDIGALLLYGAGDLFLMPSTFEPCGISQMLAMREGQPCVVNQVGGLKETVQDGVNGFSFRGDSLAEQADKFVAKTSMALALHKSNPTRFRQIRDAARATRFAWRDSAKKYIELLYR